MSVEESDPEAKAQLSGFTQALAQLGWTEGRNLRMEVRWGGSSDVNRARSLAKELVALKPDVILSQGTPVTAAFKRETQTIPIVFVVVTDPVGDGFVAGLPHPGGNITGFLTSESGITAKMRELLSEIAPGLKRIAILFNPDTAPGGGAYYLRDFEAAAQSSKVESVVARARSDAEIESAVTALGENPGAGLVVMPDFFVRIHVQPIILLAARNKVPTIYPWRFVVSRDGGLLSYGPDLKDIVRRGAVYVDQVLRGAKPAEEPHEVRDEHGTICRAAVHTYGDTIHSLISYRDYKGPFLPGFIAAPIPGDDAGILRIELDGPVVAGDLIRLPAALVALDLSGHGEPPIRNARPARGRSP
jgi:putative ABC transport system substrate-binding protein